MASVSLSVLVVLLVCGGFLLETRAKRRGGGGHHNNHNHNHHQHHDHHDGSDPDATPPPLGPPGSWEAMQTLLVELRSRVEKLEEQCAGRPKVAFHASLLPEDQHADVGPDITDLNLLFKRVMTNVGDAYNSTTGVFTAPERGVYYVRFTLNVGSTGSVNAALLVNGEAVASLYETAGANNSGATGAALRLEQGDEVFVVLWSGHSVFDNSRLSSFSGFLLFTE